MTEHFKEWYCVKFCQKLGNSQVETINKIQQDHRISIRELWEDVRVSIGSVYLDQEFGYE